MMLTQSGDQFLDVSVLEQFSAGPKYLNTATVGLPSKATVEAVKLSLDDWAKGHCDPFVFDDAVARARSAFAEIVGAPVQSTAIVSQVSVVSGMVAASLPERATVLCAEEDFTSVLFPFLVGDRLNIKLVPLSRLLDSIDASIDLVAVSAVQSADGRVLDLDRLAELAEVHQVRTYVDVTQAAGWLSINAGRFDVTSCGAYKWLCSPRGSGFLTVSETADWLRPTYAGWYAGDDPWTSVYGPPLRLAPDARRFNASPAWFDFVGAAHATELLARVGVDAINRHSVALANAFRTGLDMAPSNSTIVSIDTEAGEALTKAGISTAARAGKVRLSFYLYNTMADVQAALKILSSP